MLAECYRTFFAAQGDALHVAAHSHHPWPDVTRDAQLAYWDDSARLTRDKWRLRIFGEAIPEAQRHLARHLALHDPARIAFAPSAHDFVARLFSCFDPRRRLRVLTTDREFYSFERQARRLEETGWLAVTRVPVEPFDGFADRFAAAARAPHDIVYLSQVMFDSGFLVERLPELLRGIPEPALIAVDGYHAFFALPVSLAGLEHRVFYLGGGYKYLQAGEGACFMTLPPAADALRPALTGWFSDAGEQSLSLPVGYGAGAMRFWGSTFDPSGVYRLNAVMRLFERLGVLPADIHAHVGRLQQRFLDGLRGLPAAAVVPPAGTPRGNFLAFDLADAAAVHARLAAAGIVMDRRGTRLRFGFGVYHDEAFVDRLLERIGRALA
jgi:selenocysteine lyase/cysteine desulfurase